MQKIVQGMAWVMLKILRTSGGESLSVAANVFVGQTEAPLVVRPYIARMTQSELFTMMVGGMATIAGAVLVGLWCSLWLCLGFAMARMQSRHSIPDPLDEQRGL